MSENSFREVRSLVAGVEAGLRPNFLFFWGHTPRKDGKVGKECLSQWWESPFLCDGIEYRTAEHFLMAEKAGLFGDVDTRKRILSAGHPDQAKKLGREVKGFCEEIWVRHRFEIVVRGNEAKFGQNERLRDFLGKTVGRVLVEASPVDRIWGIGLAGSAPEASDPRKWQGLNLLGFALMEVRARLFPR